MVYAGVSEIAPDASELSQTVATYLAVYVPVRWIEWAVFDLILNRGSRSVSGFFFGTEKRPRFWRLDGIVLSCLADFPVIAQLGGLLPLGRFMC